MLADELWLITHDDRSGRERLHPRAVGLGLASALLAELVLGGWVQVFQGGLYVMRQDAPQDVLAHQVLAQLVARRQHREVRTWLAFFAESARDSVTERLVQAGRVEPVRYRRLVRQRVTYLPVDVNDAAWPEARIVEALTGGRQMSQEDVVLAGLVSAVGMLPELLYMPERRAYAQDYLSWLVGQLPASLRELLAYTEAAAGDAVLAPR